MGRPAKYPEEFKREAVELYRSSDRPRVEVAKSLGISDGSLAAWVKQALTQALIVAAWTRARMRWPTVAEMRPTPPTPRRTDVSGIGVPSREILRARPATVPSSRALRP